MPSARKGREERKFEVVLSDFPDLFARLITIQHSFGSANMIMTMTEVTQGSNERDRGRGGQDSRCGGWPRSAGRDCRQDQSLSRSRRQPADHRRPVVD